MTTTEAIAAIKKLVFNDAAPVPPAPVDPVAPVAAPPASWLVDGGQPVFVNISDDGVADIDANDTAFSDAAMTLPYPDGTYNVTGTDFGFTVAGGIVSAISDVDGTGPGAAVGAEAATVEPPLETPTQMRAAVRAEFKAEFKKDTDIMVGKIATLEAGFTKQTDINKQLLELVESLSLVEVSKPLEEVKTWDDMTPLEKFRSQKIEN